MSVLSNMPKTLITKFYDKVKQFLWGSEMSRIAITTLCLPEDQGGLRLVGLNTKQKLFKIQWIFCIRNDPLLQEIAVTILIPNLGHYIWQRNLNVKDITYLIPETSFWREALEAWCENNFITPTSPESIRAQILWCNSCIKVGGKPIKWEGVMRAGVNKVIDLISGNRFYTHDEFCKN